MNAENPEAIRQIEKTIHYVFEDKSLLRQAFTRGSYVNEAHQRGNRTLQSNEVLEFCGDTVLSAAIISCLMEKYSARGRYGMQTELDEGDFSRIKSNLSNKTMLSTRMGELDLQRYLIVNAGDLVSGTVDEPSVKEDLFESIIGAVYFDCGKKMETVIGVVSAMLNIDRYFDTHKERGALSSKNALNEFCDSRNQLRLPYPEYKLLAKEGADNDPLYHIVCLIGEKVYGEGRARNQKNAEQAAAAMTLEMLREEYPDVARATPVLPSVNAKNQLSEYAQKKHLPLPVYTRETEEVVNNLHYFTVRCDFDGVTATARACSKKEAEKLAALEQLRRRNQSIL